jgi:large conductance mechanosensitive channel
MLKEFQKFIMRGNVLDLAVGVIIGLAFGTVITSLVNDVIMPPIGWLLGGVDFSNLVITLPQSPLAAAGAAPVTINIGLFINAVINFLIVSFAVFLLVRAVNGMMERFKKKEEAVVAAVISNEERLASAIEKLNANLEKMNAGK